MSQMELTCLPMLATILRNGVMGELCSIIILYVLLLYCYIVNNHIHRISNMKDAPAQK